MTGKVLLIFLLITWSFSATAQSYAKEDDIIFLWQVKQINEFMERFNKDEKTELIQYYKKQSPPVTFARERLIKSLFNSEDKNWNYNDITNFIEQADDTIRPQCLDFLGNKWNAIVKCRVAYKGKPETIIFTLQVQKLPAGASKWLITGADAGFLKHSDASQDIIKIPEPRDPTVALSPSSNGTDFLDIDKVSSDKVNIRNFFLQADIYKDDVPLVESEILKGHLIIKHAISIIYDIKQIPGWDMRIEQYNRHSMNSGWLISKLTRAPR